MSLIFFFLEECRFAGSPPEIVFPRWVPIGICRAKWKLYYNGNCVRAAGAADDDFNFSIKLFHIFSSLSSASFISHFNEANSAPTMKIPNEDDNNVNVLFSLRILQHFLFASAQPHIPLRSARAKAICRCNSFNNDGNYISRLIKLAPVSHGECIQIAAHQK